MNYSKKEKINTLDKDKKTSEIPSKTQMHATLQHITHKPIPSIFL